MYLKEVYKNILTGDQTTIKEEEGNEKYISYDESTDLLGGDDSGRGGGEWGTAGGERGLGWMRTLLDVVREVREAWNTMNTNVLNNNIIQ